MENKKVLIGKTALITGASSGIGKAIAELFAEAGSNVVINANKNLSGAEKLASTINEKYGNQVKAIAIKADLSVNCQVKNLILKTVEVFGSIDVLVNNSGTGTLNSNDNAIDILEEDWDLVLDVNLKGALLTIKYALPFMIKKGAGSIINISSIRGLLGATNLVSYCSSKGGMVLLTKQLAVEYGIKNIRVNCICPGFIETEMFKNYLNKQKDPSKALKIFQDMAPLKRIGKPSEVANVALFLASEEASFITGAVITVDGGYTVFGPRNII